MIKLLQAVINRIDELFPYTNIYTREVPQGLVEPCFFVSLIDTKIDLEFQRRYRVDSLVNIVYMDQRADSFLKEDIEQKLLYGMRNISLDTGGIYGFKPESKIDEREVNFLINYRYTSKEALERDPYMMEIENIIHYTEKEPYEEKTKKPNPGMWETETWPREEYIFPKINPLDPRNTEKRKDKEFEIEDGEDLMWKKEVNIYDKK